MHTLFCHLANKLTSFPLVSPFSNHSTVTVRESQLSPLTMAECTRPETTDSHFYSSVFD